MTYSELLLSAGPLKPAAKKKAARAKAKFEMNQQEGRTRPHRWGTGISSESSSPPPKPKGRAKPGCVGDVSSAPQLGLVTECGGAMRGPGRAMVKLEEQAAIEFNALRATTSCSDLFTDQFPLGAHRRLMRNIAAGQKELAKAACGAALLLRFIGRGWDGW
jgi:hypothetical protein